MICNKFLQQSPVTCLIWLTEGPLVHGLADGKVRAAHLKSNKAQTLYSTGSYVVSLASKYEILCLQLWVGRRGDWDLSYGWVSIAPLF